MSSSRHCGFLILFSTNNEAHTDFFIVVVSVRASSLCSPKEKGIFGLSFSFSKSDSAFESQFCCCCFIYYFQIYAEGMKKSMFQCSTSCWSLKIKNGKDQGLLGPSKLYFLTLQYTNEGLLFCGKDGQDDFSNIFVGISLVVFVFIEL